MTRAGRREMLGWLALAPLAVALPVPATARAVRLAPIGAFTLTRVLEREMAGGALLIVKRAWSCRFEPIATGARVAGEQTHCEVSAPRELAALAEMEKRRSVTGFLPLSLDENGRIADAGEGTDEALDKVIATATQLLGHAAGSGERAWLAALGQTSAAAVSQVPPDLLFPQTVPQAFSRELALPEGGTGTLAVTIEAVTDPVSGLLTASTRRVVTSAAGFTRAARETWQLAAH